MQMPLCPSIRRRPQMWRVRGSKDAVHREKCNNATSLYEWMERREKHVYLLRKLESSLQIACGLVNTMARWNLIQTAFLIYWSSGKGVLAANLFLLYFSKRLIICPGKFWETLFLGSLYFVRCYCVYAKVFCRRWESSRQGALHVVFPSHAGYCFLD